MQQQIDAQSGLAVGWTAFAAMTMIMMGCWWLTTGLVAIFEPAFYVATQDWVFKFDAKTWGGIHFLTGIVILAAGFGLFNGAVWARTIGVIMALLAGLIAFAWLPWHPVWGAIKIGISLFVMWALTVHGRDITAWGVRRTNLYNVHMRIGAPDSLPYPAPFFSLRYAH